MAEFPVDPNMSKMIIAAEKYGVVEEILSITAMLNIGGALFFRPKDRVIESYYRLFKQCPMLLLWLILFYFDIILLSLFLHFWSLIYLDCTRRQCKDQL